MENTIAEGCPVNDGLPFTGSDDFDGFTRSNIQVT